MTIKNFSIEYDAINSKNTFTDGDTVNGRIIVETSKETKIQSLVFTAQGKASIGRNEPHRKSYYSRNMYWTRQKYYNVKQHILKEARQQGDMEVLDKGRHVFPFSFKIPDRKLPSSFKDSSYKIVHRLKAALKQPTKPTKKAKRHFTFVSKADMDIPSLMDPQHGCKDKSVTTFGSGNISMDAYTKRMGYKQGKALQVRVEVKNDSTRSVKPKFTLYEKNSFFAQGHKRVCTNDILKEKIESIESSGKETVTKVIAIPSELPPSILNCSILKREYILRIYLNVKYAADPEIKLPIVILHSSEVRATEKQRSAAAFGEKDQVSRSTKRQPQPAPQAADTLRSSEVPATTMAAAFGEQDQVPWSTTPQPQPAPEAADPPPPHGAHAMYPPSN